MNREELIKCAKEIQDFCNHNEYCIEDECPFMSGDACVFTSIPAEWELERLDYMKKLKKDNLEQFAQFVAKEIFDDDWDINKDAFVEIACRKLAKLGIVKAKGDEWELIQRKCEGDNEL